MPLYMLDDELWFPPVEEALPDGLLAIGGELSADRLLLAYRSGIFPWYNEDEIPMWWSPDPRFVLFPEELKVSKSMKQVMRSGKFQSKINTCFRETILNCATVDRKGMDGTWISDEVIDAYMKMHELGHAISAETWLDGGLVGGLYGIKLGNLFFGESMFSKVSNASKFAFISLVAQLKKEGVAMIDCQVHTDHLGSLGARMIPRTDFISLLQRYIN